MDIQLLAFPDKDDADLLRAVAALTAALRERGAVVTADVGQWVDRQPDVIHAIGVEAAQIALDASPRVPVVVSFDADEPDPPRERVIARRADAILVTSTGERRAWTRAGVPAARVHVWHLPADIPRDDAVTPADGAVVVTDADGDDLALVTEAARRWAGAGLVPLTDRSADDVIARASVAVATRHGRRGGLAVRAARHGVPSIVLDRGVSTHQVVDGASGLVLRAGCDSAELARAVDVLLRSRLLCRGFGMAALRRVKATRNADLAADRALAAYSATVRRQCADATSKSAELPEQRERLTVEHLDLAAQLARRYDGRGQSLEDLVQVANLGLVQAARRFDPDRGSSFSAFAVPTILGELKRYFRDQAWSVRVPRPIQEAALEVDAVSRDVEGRHGGAPTADEVAREAKMSRDDVRAAQRARAEALSHASLNRVVDDDEGAHEIGDAIGSSDDGYAAVEARATVREALAGLPEREREVVAMRFFGDNTQAQIAQRLGVSQVQVSRLLRRTLDTLRDELTAEPG